jgi:two-component system, NarL family, response regulator NreC
MSIRVLLADDHKLFREGLRSLIEEQPRMKVVAEAGDGRTALQFAQSLSPDVVVMDISMPEMNGMEATRQIICSAPGVKVLVLSMHNDIHFVSEMLKAGASGYLLKDCAFEELIHAIFVVAEQATYLSPQITIPSGYQQPLPAGVPADAE